MAGFNSMGRISPPILFPRVASGRLSGLNNPGSQYRSNAFSNPSVVGLGADTSPQHLANVWMQQQGLGNTQSSYDPSESPYGFTAQDFNDIQRFLSNPLSSANSAGYQNIVNRTRNVWDRGPMGMNQEEFEKFTLDFPLRLASGFNFLPPPVLQNLHIPRSSIPGMAF